MTATHKLSSAPKTAGCSNGAAPQNHQHAAHGNAPTRYVSLVVCLGLAARTIWQSLYLTGTATTSSIFSTTTSGLATNSSKSWSASITLASSQEDEKAVPSEVSDGYHLRVFNYLDDLGNDYFPTVAIGTDDRRVKDDDFISTLLSSTTSAFSNPSYREIERENVWIPRSGRRKRILEYPMSSHSVNTTMTPSGPNSSLREFERVFYEDCRPILNRSVIRIHPTCNTMHELNFASSKLSLLSMAGSWRSVWKVSSALEKEDSIAILPCSNQETHCSRNNTNVPGVETVHHPLTLKVLHLDRIVNEESFEVHAVDSIVMEKMTASPYVVTSFVFCGTSIVTDFASSTARQVLKNSKLNSLTRLRLARDLARGLADLHALRPLPWSDTIPNYKEQKFLDNEPPSTGKDYEISKPAATDRRLMVVFAHHDINIANVLQVDHRPRPGMEVYYDGMPDIKLEEKGKNQQHQANVKIQWNDFNLGIWLREPLPTESRARLSTSIRSTNDSQCLVPVRYESPLWRSPEEISNASLVQADKSDIYSFGNILFQILTKHQSWTHLEHPSKPSLEVVAKAKANGKYPRIPSKYIDNNINVSANGDNKIGGGYLERIVLYEAIQACYRFNPLERPTAYELANVLSTAYNWIHHGRRAWKRRNHFPISPRDIQMLFKKQDD